LPIDRRLVYGVLGSVIVLALAQAEDAGRLPWLGRRWIARLGDSSYSLYLLHIPIISLLCKGILKLGVTNPIALVAMFFLVVLACVGASVLFYMAIERPMLEMLRSKKHHADRAEPDQRRDPVLTITRPGFGTLPGALDSRFADARGRRSHDVRWQ
jgi:peptidoglycan/LPS O-acetylase OafA/YrhL